MATEERYAKFHRLSGLLIVLCLFVILWGAFVRFSHSGDGCGESWPLCGGAFVPLTDEISPWIEYTHRLSSGIFGILVLLLWWMSFRVTERGHPLRTSSTHVLIFTIIEALVGAGLVLRGLVGEDDSLERAVWLALHMCNTLILLGTLVRVHLQSRDPLEAHRFTLHRRQLPLLFLFLILAVAGSLASLGNTLYPSGTLLDGIASDFNSESPFLIRVRLLHPIIGFLFFLIVIKWWQRARLSYPEHSQRLLIFTGGNFLIGAVTLLLLSPLTGRLIHILMADCIWIELVGLALLGPERDEDIVRSDRVRSLPQAN